MAARIQSAIVLLLALFACGREDIVVARTSDVPDAASTTGSDAHADVDGGETCNPVPPNCRPLGASCAGTTDCCSLRCEGGTCLERGVCKGPGTSCATRADCCSGRCEPVAGTSARACSNYCLADTTACVRAEDCCGLDCNGGVCGGAVCKLRSDSCTTNAECCSGVCDPANSQCALDPATSCRATGETCTSGGGASCCAGCNVAENRCDFGPGPCRPSGAICAQAADCCRGACTANGAGVTVCVAACLGDGTACASSSDCCGHVCTGAPARCAQMIASCTLFGGTCAGGSECCSGQCLGGACGTCLK